MRAIDCPWGRQRNSTSQGASSDAEENFSFVAARRFGWALCTNFPARRSEVTLDHLDARMEQEQPQQLPAGVPGRPGDRDPDHGPSPSRYSTIRPGMLTPVVSMLFRNSIV